MPLLPASTIFTDEDATTPIMTRTIIAKRTILAPPGMLALSLGD